MDHKKKFYNSLEAMQLLSMFRCKYTFKADIESRGMYIFWKTLLFFEDTEVRGRMRKKRYVQMLTNICFSALNYAVEVMAIEQIIKSKMSIGISSENQAFLMWDNPGNRSKTFDMQIAESLFQFCHSLPILVENNIPQWNCCLGNMANVWHLMGDTECEDIFRTNVDRHWSQFHQKLIKHDKRLLYKSTHLFTLCNLFLYIILVTAYSY